MIKAILFDLDGIIADTERPKFGLLKKLLKKKGLNLLKKHYSQSIGVRTKIFLNQTFGDQISPEDLEDVFHQRLDELYKHPEKYIKKFPYVKGVVQRLFKQGFTLAIASSSYEKDIELVLGQLGLREYFSVIQGFSEEMKPKPAPDIYANCLKKLNLSGSDCLAIEDSAVGIASAQSAGCRCIAVTNSLSRKELAQADLILNNLSKLSREYLEKKFK